MPTTKPRISITLERSDLAVLDRFAAASRTPRASVLAELVHGVIPQIERAAKLMELANAAPRKVIEGLLLELDAATDNVMGSVDHFQQEYEDLIAALAPVPGTTKTKKRGLPPGATGARGQRVPVAPGRPQSGPQDPHLLTGGSNS